MISMFPTGWDKRRLLELVSLEMAAAKRFALIHRDSHPVEVISSRLAYSHYRGKNIDLRLCTVKCMWSTIAKSKRESYNSATYVPFRVPRGLSYGASIYHLAINREIVVNARHRKTATCISNTLTIRWPPGI